MDEDTTPLVKDSLAVCYGCHNTIFDANVLEAMGYDWHGDCFRCSDCGTLLRELGQFFERDKKAFCMKHAQEPLACFRCKAHIISGNAIDANGYIFHSKCFDCRQCSTLVPYGGRFLLDVDDTGPVGTIVCESCVLSSEDSSETVLVEDNVNGETASKPPNKPPSKPPKIRILKSRCLSITTEALRDTNNSLSSASTNNCRSVILSRRNSLGFDVAFMNSNDFGVQDAETQLKKMMLSDEVKAITKAKVSSRTCTNESNISSSINSEIAVNESSIHFLEMQQKARSKLKKKLLHVHEYTPSQLIVIDFKRDIFIEDENDGVKIGRKCLDESRVRSSQLFRKEDIEIGEVLGRGFYGVVYKGIHKRTNERIALKECMEMNPDARLTFLKEVSLLKVLIHPNILRFIGAIAEPEKLFLITEFVTGGELRDLLRNMDIDLSWAKRWGFAMDIANAMFYLHEKGIIHRDLKAENCLLSESGDVIVADFGLAKALPRKKRSYQTTKTVCGSPYWMAPEVLKYVPYDKMADVFSFGVLLAEILVRDKVTADDIPRTSDFGIDAVQLLELVPDAPRPLFDLVLDCCTVNPSRRETFDIVVYRLDEMSIVDSKII